MNSCHNALAKACFFFSLFLTAGACHQVYSAQVVRGGKWVRDVARLQAPVSRLSLHKHFHSTRKARQKLQKQQDRIKEKLQEQKEALDRLRELIENADGAMTRTRAQKMHDAINEALQLPASTGKLDTPASCDCCWDDVQENSFLTPQVRRLILGQCAEFTCDDPNYKVEADWWCVSFVRITPR